jgi:hypothetical protein
MILWRNLSGYPHCIFFLERAYGEGRDCSWPNGECRAWEDRTGPEIRHGDERLQERAEFFLSVRTLPGEKMTERLHILPKFFYV